VERHNKTKQDNKPENAMQGARTICECKKMRETDKQIFCLRGGA
jgi:hypothetical protein